MKSAPAFKTEAELCAAFIKWADEQGWTAYAETADWDILLVRRSDGTQCGVQAKLRFNATLLRQVLPSRPCDDVGPNYRAVLLPQCDFDIRDVCVAIGIELICFQDTFYSGNLIETEPNRFERIDARSFGPALSHLRYDWNPAKQIPLPEFVPDVAAGASGPTKLTSWKIQALKVCAALEIDTFITTKRIRELGINPGRWIVPSMGWLVKNPNGVRGEYIRGPRLRFNEQHPTVYRQILEQMRNKGEGPA